jgi:hypothetical protein
MKTARTWRFFLLFALPLCMPTVAPARQRVSDLRYEFSVGQTNVYHMEVQVRSETGQETTAGNVFLVPTEVGSNVCRLSCRAALEVKRDMQRGPFGYFGGMYPGGPAVLPEGCEVQIDSRGHVLREAGDRALPIPLGSVIHALLEPLPESPSASRWESSDESTVMDYPLWVGPALGFYSPQPFGPPFFMNSGPRQTMAVLVVSRHVDCRVTAVTPETKTIHKHLSLVSLLKLGSEPRVSATGDGDLVFDGAAGLFKNIEMQYSTASATETTSRNAKVGIKCHLLGGAELTASLAPPAPPPPPPLSKPTADELQTVIADLQSADVGTRRDAAGRLRNAELTSPPPELFKLMASLCVDSDNSIRQSAANFLKTYGTTNEVPALLKLLKDSDWETHRTAVKALGRIKDERAIEPLIDDLARGMSPVQQEAVAALVNIGSPAETAVLQMFKERNLETRRQACRLLQQIGTSKSIDPLKDLVSDPDQSLSQAAVEALRAIKFRE